MHFSILGRTRLSYHPKCRASEPRTHAGTHTPGQALPSGELSLRVPFVRSSRGSVTPPEPLCEPLSYLLSIARGGQEWQNSTNPPALLALEPRTPNRLARTLDRTRCGMARVFLVACGPVSGDSTCIPAVNCCRSIRGVGSALIQVKSPSPPREGQEASMTMRGSGRAVCYVCPG